MVLLVSYDLKSPGGDYSGLFKELKASDGWWHYLESTWLIFTNETPQELYDRLGKHTHKEDRVLVIEIAKPAPRQGWLPQKAWMWIKNHIGA